MSAAVRTAIGTAAAIAVSALASALISRDQGPRWYSVGAAAKAIGYSYKQVRRWLEAGQIEGAWQRGPGSHWRIPRAWVMGEMAKGQRAVIRRRQGT